LAKNVRRHNNRINKQAFFVDLSAKLGKSENFDKSKNSLQTLTTRHFNIAEK
jgi:hypothetical protein